MVKIQGSHRRFGSLAPAAHRTDVDPICSFWPKHWGNACDTIAWKGNKHLVGGFKHEWIIYHFIYGMSSFPLTNSYFSRWLKPLTRHVFFHWTPSRFVALSKGNRVSSRDFGTSSSILGQMAAQKRGTSNMWKMTKLVGEKKRFIT